MPNPPVAVGLRKRLWPAETRRSVTCRQGSLAALRVAQVHRRVHGPVGSRPVASIQATKTGYAVKWRLGGKRSGAPQTASFSGRPALKLAERVKGIVEAHQHRITREKALDLADTSVRAHPSGTPSFADWVGEYIAGRRRVGDVQPDTIDRYEDVLRHRVVPFLGAWLLPEITPDVVGEWVIWAKRQRTPRGRPVSPETIRRAHAILHGCLGAAVPVWLATNPAARPHGSRKGIAGLPKPEPHDAVFLERWEVDLILANLRPDVRDMAEVDLRTGLRLGELVVLRARDIVLDGRRKYIDVCRALKDDGSIGPPKSAKSRRKVTVSGRALEILARRVAGLAADDLVFAAPEGGMWRESNLRARHWLPAVAAAKRCGEHPPPLPMREKPTGPVRKWGVGDVSTCMCSGRLKRQPRWHDLRHTHASLLIEAGWSPKRVQLRMGHASFQVTMDIYGHLWDGDDADRLDDVDRLLGGDPEPEVVPGRRAVRVRGARPAVRHTGRRAVAVVLARDEAG